MAVAAAPKLVGRHLRVAFMNTDATGSSPKYERMTNFTAMTMEKPEVAFPDSTWMKARRDQM